VQLPNDDLFLLRCFNLPRLSGRALGIRFTGPVKAGEKDDVEKFINVNKGHMATDHDGDPVYMTRLQWDIDRVERDHPDLNLTSTKDIML